MATNCQYPKTEQFQYPKKTPYEVRQEMDRIENSKSKPLNNFSINGIDWEKRIDKREKRRQHTAQTKDATLIKKAKAASHVLCYRAYLDYLIGK